MTAQPWFGCAVTIFAGNAFLGPHARAQSRGGNGLKWRMTHRAARARLRLGDPDRKSTRLNSSHANISYAVFCLKKKKRTVTKRMEHPRLPAAWQPGVRRARPPRHQPHRRLAFSLISR